MVQVQKKVRAMCAVMRVAVALDRCDSSAIDDVHVFQQTESILLVSTKSAINIYGVQKRILCACAFLPKGECDTDQWST